MLIILDSALHFKINKMKSFHLRIALKIQANYEEADATPESARERLMSVGQTRHRGLRTRWRPS